MTNTTVKEEIDFNESLPCIDTSLVKIERTDGSENSDFSQNDEPDFTIIAESIIVKEEYQMQPCVQGVLYSPVHGENRREYTSSLGKLDNEEHIFTSTSLHSTGTQKQNPSPKIPKYDTKNRSANTAYSGYNCSYCSKPFKRKSQLEIHVRVHTGEKPYECNECQIRFSSNSNLRVHFRIHTGEKPYICTVCSKKCTQLSHLKSHARTHTRDRPYKCRECSKEYKIKYSLQKHTRTHTGECPYVMV